MNSKNADQNKGSNQGREEKLCADYARSFVRGFITVYMAWFLGVDAEDGFWSTYFKPLEGLWTDGRARKDVSLMRDKGLVMKDRLRLTEKGWGCMEDAIVKFLKGEFGEYQDISIVREYPEAVLVAPGFAYEHGIDLLDIANTIARELVERSEERHIPLDTMSQGVLDFINDLLEVPEVEDYKDPSIVRARVNIGNIVRARIKGIVDYQDYVGLVIKAKPSRWLIPIIPYLINLGYKLVYVGAREDLPAPLNDLPALVFASFLASTSDAVLWDLTIVFMVR